MRAILILLALCAVAQGQVPKTQELKDGHVGYNAAYTADVPQGTDGLAMVLVTTDDWQTDPGPRGQAQRKLKAWLENDKRLIQYRSSMEFSWLTPSNPLFSGARTLANGQTSSLRARLGDNHPTLAIERKNGEAVFKMSAASMPTNGGELADWVTSALKAAAPAAPRFSGQSEATPITTEGEPCPGPDCTPNSTPPVPNDNSEVILDTPKPPSTTDTALAVAVIAAGGAGAAGIAAAASKIKTKK